jgi:hypothetical protein
MTISHLLQRNQPLRWMILMMIFRSNPHLF